MSDQLPDIERILTLLREAGWREAHLRFGDFELTVSDTPSDAGAAPTPLRADAGADTRSEVSVGAAEPTPATTSPASGDGDQLDTTPTGDEHVVTAASIGVFWRSPQPGARPFVEVGDTVEPDTTVCILEVMKLMTHVKARAHGVVRAIHVENGAMVEHGDALVAIEPR